MTISLEILLFIVHFSTNYIRSFEWLILLLHIKDLELIRNNQNRTSLVSSSPIFNLCYYKEDCTFKTGFILNYFGS